MAKEAQVAKKSLEEAKKEVSRLYMGHAGIHGVGIRRTRNAICVYYDREPKDGSLSEIRKLVAPYALITVRDDRPSFASRVRSMFGRH